MSSISKRAAGDHLRKAIAIRKEELEETERALAALEGSCRHVWKALPNTVRVIEGGERTDSQGWKPRTYYVPPRHITVYHRECETCGKQESTERWRSIPTTTTEPNWSDDYG